MERRNPFLEADHIMEPPTDLRERILRSATDRRGLMALAGLFTGSYLTSFLRLMGAKGPPRSERSEVPKNTNNEKP